MATMARGEAVIEELRELSAGEAEQILDGAARYFLHMSGAEFLQRWTSGAFGPNPDDTPGVIEVLSLMPSLTSCKA